VVSGAAGSVGSLACQIGKLKGAKVIGIAGTDEKCRWLKEEVKIDAALNYKSPTFHNEFKDTVGYLDVFFDNVGGEILNFALTRLNKGARIALCGESKLEKLFVDMLTLVDDVPQVPSPITVRSLLSGCRVVLKSHVTDNPKPKGLSSYMNLITQRAKIEGFIM
jgi:NADPH:quinone reductase-like Zn-dependent oxidoreductase